MDNAPIPPYEDLDSEKRHNMKMLLNSLEAFVAKNKEFESGKVKQYIVSSELSLSAGRLNPNGGLSTYSPNEHDYVSVRYEFGAKRTREYEDDDLSDEELQEVEQTLEMYPDATEFSIAEIVTSYKPITPEFKQAACQALGIGDATGDSGTLSAAEITFDESDEYVKHVHSVEYIYDPHTATISLNTSRFYRINGSQVVEEGELAYCRHGNTESYEPIDVITEQDIVEFSEDLHGCYGMELLEDDNKDDNLENLTGSSYIDTQPLRVHEMKRIFDIFHKKLVENTIGEVAARAYFENPDILDT